LTLPAITMAGVRVLRYSADQDAMTTLLDNVNWEVRQGEHWTVMGPNGAGKTTLLRIAGANSHPTGGEVTILGRELGRYDVRLLRERIGFVDERLDRSLRARGRMSCREIVLTGALGTVALLSDRLRPEQEERADRLLDLVGLSAIADRRFADCSHGERGRLLIARSLMPEPDLLLLDEPAAGLDLPARENLVRAMVDTAEAHPRMPSVTITHHVEEIPPTCTHALLLRDGAVFAAGPVDEVLTSTLVSECFGVPVKISRAGGRFGARIDLAA